MATAGASIASEAGAAVAIAAAGDTRPGVDMAAAEQHAAAVAAVIMARQHAAAAADLVAAVPHVAAAVVQRVAAAAVQRVAAAVAAVDMPVAVVVDDANN
jgi:hypothetical protein